VGSRGKAPVGSRGKAPVGSRGKAPVGSRGKAPVGSRGKAPVGSRGNTPDFAEIKKKSLHYSVRCGMMIRQNKHSSALSRENEARMLDTKG